MKDKKTIKEMSRTKASRGVRDSVTKKIGQLCHISSKKSKNFLLPHFKSLFRSNMSFAVIMKNKLDLSENEIEFLLGDKYIHKLKEIIQLSEKIDEKQIEIKSTPKSEIKKEAKESKQEIKQPSIFDF